MLTTSLARSLAIGSLVALAAGAVTAARAADPFEIPVIMPLSGSGAFLGKGEAQSLQLIESIVNKRGGINGRPLHFAIADDQSSPQVAVQLTNAAIAKKPPVMIGSSLVSMCNAMAPLVKADGPVQYCLSPGIHPARDSYTFSSAISTKDTAAVAMRFFKGHHWNRIAMITSTDATGQDAEAGFDEAVARPENRALQIVTHEHFNTSDVSVSAQIASMRAAHPDVVIAWSTGTPFGTVLRGISDGGLTQPVLGGNGNLTYVQMAQYKQILPQAMYFPSPRFLAREQVGPGPLRDAQTLFYSSFKSIDVVPDIAQSYSWDPGLILVEALQKLGTSTTPDTLRKYLENLHGFAGIDGVYDFRDGNQRGLTGSAAVIIRWDAAKNTWIGASRPGGDPLR